MNICSTLDTLASLSSMDYNIVEDMKKTWANISLFELTKV